MINRFLLEKLGIPTATEYQYTEDTLEEKDDPPLEEDEGETLQNVSRKVRSALFRRRVKDYYDETCAICGSSRKTPEGTPGSKQLTSILEGIRDEITS